MVFFTVSVSGFKRAIRGNVVHHILHEGIENWVDSKVEGWVKLIVILMLGWILRYGAILLKRDRSTWDEQTPGSADLMPEVKRWEGIRVKTGLDSGEKFTVSWLNYTQLLEKKHFYDYVSK